MSGEQFAQAVIAAVLIVAGLAGLVFPQLSSYFDRSHKEAAERFADIGLDVGLRNYERDRKILRIAFPLVLLVVGLAFLLSAAGLIGG